MEKIYETERLIIRKWEDKDYMDLYEYAKDPEITKFLTFQPYTSEKDAVERITYIKGKYVTEAYVHSYAVELKKEKKVIGSIDIVDYSPNAEGTVEIGFMLSRQYQGNGYMTEALVNYFKYIKKNNIAKRIICKHDTLNEKSGNVMKRAGMSFEGILRKAGNKNNIHSRFDLALYSILYEEIEI